MIGTYLTDSITIKRNVYNEWGEPNTNTNTVIKGRVNYKIRLVKDINGNDVVSSAEVLMIDRDLLLTDRLIFDNVEHEIIDIHRLKDFSNTYLKVLIS